MAYFDVRPSAHAPTLELRICDACPIVDDAIADRRPVPRDRCGPPSSDIATAARSIRCRRRCIGRPSGRPRAAGWRACCSTLPPPQRRCRPPRRSGRCCGGSARSWRSSATGTWSGSWPRRLLARGNSADRQRAAYAERGRLERRGRAGGRRDPRPTGGPEPAVAAAPCRRYRFRAGDEAVGPGLQPRPVYRDLIEFYRRTGEARARALAKQRPRGLGGPSRADVRGRGREAALPGRPGAAGDQPARVARLGRGTDPARPGDRGLPARRLRRAAHSGRRRAAAASCVGGRTGLARRGAPAAGGRGPRRRSWASTWSATSSAAGGCWRTTCATPAVPAYAIAIRDLMDAVLPDLPRPDGLLDPADALPQLRDCSAGAAPARTATGGAAVAAGRARSAWFEHRLLAERGGLAAGRRRRPAVRRR